MDSHSVNPVFAGRDRTEADQMTYLMVLANPVSPELDDEFNDWYSHVHIPDLLQLGVVASSRYRLSDPYPIDADVPHQYLAVHEIPTKDLTVVLGRIRDEQVAGRMGHGRGLDENSANGYFFVPASERLTIDMLEDLLADPRYDAIKATEHRADTKLKMHE